MTLFKLSHHIHLQFEENLSVHGIPEHLTGPRMRFLAVVAEDGPIRMSDLGAKLGIKARTVTQFVDALERAQLLERLPDPNDRRATLVRIRDDARPIIRKAGDAMTQAAEKTLAHVTENDLRQLVDVLLKIADVRDNNEDMYASE
jgi:DNA-binding MarR family transcriptional regulator